MAGSGLSKPIIMIGAGGQAKVLIRAESGFGES